MSGHFILKNITTAQKDECLAKYAQSSWSVLQHAAVGWNAGSRLVLQNALSGQNINNRNGLPPHRYLGFPAGQPTVEQLTFLSGHDADWIRDMVRPNSPGLGLTGLCPNAAAEWAQGRKKEALIEQIKNGATSIEIYYLNGNEMA